MPRPAFPSLVENSRTPWVFIAIGSPLEAGASDLRYKKLLKSRAVLPGRIFAPPRGRCALRKMSSGSIETRALSRRETCRKKPTAACASRRGPGWHACRNRHPV
jgi:hypothetical protein